MKTYKLKSVENIEERLSGIEEGSVRHQVLSSAKNFKTSWMDLAQSLYSVYKDKLYKEWGYGQFEVYTAKEIGIKKETAMKLLRSYYFLEKEEPSFLQKDRSEEAAVKMPSYEAVDVLRLAKNKKLDSQDYNSLKEAVLEKGKDVRDVKKELGVIIRQRKEFLPEETRKERKFGVLRRLLGVLKSIKQDVEITKIVSASLIKEIDLLAKKLELEIER